MPKNGCKLPIPYLPSKRNYARGPKHRRDLSSLVPLAAKNCLVWVNQDVVRLITRHLFSRLVQSEEGGVHSKK